MAINVRIKMIAVTVMMAGSASPNNGAGGVGGAVNVGVGVTVEVGDGFAVGVGVAVGIGIVVGEGMGDAVGIGVGVGVGVGAAVTVNELLVPVWVPSVAVMVTSEPAVVTVTEVEPTPLTKAVIAVGLIVPAEYVKDGVPL